MTDEPPEGLSLEVFRYLSQSGMDQRAKRTGMAMLNEILRKATSKVRDGIYQAEDAAVLESLGISTTTGGQP